MKGFQLNSNSNTKFSIGNYYPALDGLRGVAILMVILNHNFTFLAISRFGWSGVDLFFVLSGFLITGILLRQRDSSQFLRNFYARRILRIFPIYYLSIIIFLFILPGVISYQFDIHYFIVNQYWFWLEIQNWLFILKPRGNNNFLDHFWSLALEEQFYLVSPWIILLIKPIQKIISLLFGILLLLLVIRLVLWHFQIDKISYINTYAFTRIDGLCIGSLLGIFRYQGSFELKKINKTLGILFFLLILIILPSFKICCHSRLPYRACCLFPVIALVWGIIVWYSIRNESLMFRIFNNKGLIFFGKISYGLYIFHWPIIRLFETDTIKFGGLSNFYVSVIATTIAIILAIISYYTYERYFLGLKKYFN